MIVGMLLIAFVALGNLAVGFVVATALGYGPIWAERRLPRRLRGDASPPGAHQAVPSGH
jgi:hypothetical protein